MSKYFSVFPFLLCIGCDLINPKEDVPAYLKISNTNVQTEPYFSSAENGFDNIWVYVNAELLGVFEIPVKIPVLARGASKVRILIGVMQDGMKSKRLSYPYLEPFDTTLEFNTGETITLNPSVSYKDNFELVLNEDFEDVEDMFEAAEFSEGEVKTSESITLSESRSIKLEALSAEDPFEIVSVNEFEVPVRTNLTMLEFLYQSTVDFAIGVYAGNQKSFELNLRANPDESKLAYVDLSSEVGVFSDSTKFTLFFDGLEPDSGDYMIFDNIRLLAPKE